MCRRFLNGMRYINPRCTYLLTYLVCNLVSMHLHVQRQHTIVFTSLLNIAHAVFIIKITLFTVYIFKNLNLTFLLFYCECLLLHSIFRMHFPAVSLCNYLHHYGTPLYRVLTMLLQL